MIFNAFLHKNIISKIIFNGKKKWKRFKITLLIALFIITCFQSYLLIIIIIFFLTVYDYIKILDIFYSKVVVIRMKLVMFSFLICFTFVLYTHYSRCLMAIKRNNFTPPTLGLWDHPHHTEYKKRWKTKKKINIFYFNFSEWGKNESISPTVLVRNQNVRSFSILLHSIWTGN